MTPDFSDTTDFEDADRGFVDRLDPRTVTDGDGRVVWDMQEYSFLNGDCPDTADPSLWRQSQLCAKDGLYEVTEGIYQLRGIDLSNMTIVEGETGILVIDPLISQETAAAALALYRKNRGDRPVTGMIYTHSHIDHFGGVVGVLPDGRGDVPILAPEGFLEHAVAENVYAGTAMGRRATYMYGALLPKGPRGHVGAGLGTNVSSGVPGLIPPTVDITHTGQEETVDGIRIIFQVTPGTEAPAEMNFLFPDHRALCMAENATHNLHNLLTLRGALVRDPRAWSRYLDQAIEMFDGGYDVAFASHHWPTWGRDRVVKYLSEQRDLYQYLHDQTLRMLNSGLTGLEIAENFPMPPALESAWHTRGYYGSVSHNVKAIYQRYMGWFDGNRRRCGSTRRRTSRHGTSNAWAARTRSGPRRNGISTTATSGSPPNSSSMRCSPTRRTATRKNYSPAPTSNSGSARRTRRGATSTSPAHSNCAAASFRLPLPNSARTC